MNDSNWMQICKSSLILGFKIKAFHFYGRSSRAEFWPFYIASWLLLLLSSLCSLLPVIGSLIQAIVVLLVEICQITASIRRLHDLNLRGWWLLFPYLLPLAYFISRQPIYVLAPDQAWLLDGMLLICIVSWIGLWTLWCKKGSNTSNRFGTDPLDSSNAQMDFINPQHMANPEYLGDPWRKFKARVDAEKQAKVEGRELSQITALATPCATTSLHQEVSQPLLPENQEHVATNAEKLDLSKQVDHFSGISNQQADNIFNTSKKM